MGLVILNYIGEIDAMPYSFNPFTSNLDLIDPDTDTDEKVKVSSNDTTAKYLEDAIVGSDGVNTTNIIEITTLNDGADEDLQIQIDETKIDHDNLLNFLASEHFTVGSIDHGSISGLNDDDHSAVYYNKSEYLNISAGAGDAGKPIKLDADGDVDATMINSVDVDHNATTNTHNLTTDIDHNTITNNHNLTTDIDHDQLTNFLASEHFTVASIDHGSISGLDPDDDHTQYALLNGRNLDILKIDDIDEYTVTHGVEIDGTVIKDDTIIPSTADGDLTVKANGTGTTYIGAAGDIELGDGTLRVMKPNTSAKIDLGDNTNQFNDGHFDGTVRTDALRIDDGSQSVSTGTGTVKMGSVNNADSSIWVPININGTTYYFPGWTTYAP